MKTSAILAFIILLSSASSFSTFAASNVDFQIKGVRGKAQDNVISYLSTIAVPRGNSFSYFESKVRTNIKQSLQVFGYYQPEIIINLTLDDDELIAFINIRLGERVKISYVNIQIRGEAKDDPEFSKLLNAVPLRIGDNLSHAKYDNFKADLNKLALARGYFDSKWQRSEISVQIAYSRAEINLIFDSMQRYVFGELSLINQTESEQIIYDLATFEVGEQYQSELVAEYSLALFNSRYFQSAAVVPNISEREEGSVPIYVSVTNHPSNTYEVGIGYLSDVGIRGKLGWTKPWINRRGDSISTELEYSNVQQEFTVNYDIPIEDPIINVARVQFGYQKKDNKDTDSQLYTLQLQRQFELESKWLRTWFLKWEQEDFVQGSQVGQSVLVLPGVSFAHTKQRGGFDPYWGNQQILSFEFASPVWGADINMAKMQGRSKYLRSIDSSHFFTTRFDLGAIYVDDITSVPASMRFFAGGSQSIRGYQYETVTPVDSDNNYIGGRYLTAASFEYGYQVFEKLRLGLFIDAGTSTNDFSEPVSVGIGTGIRWLTPIGPVKIDLAFPVHSDTDNNFTFHLYVGPEL